MLETVFQHVFFYLRLSQGETFRTEYVLYFVPSQIKLVGCFSVEGLVSQLILTTTACKEQTVSQEQVKKKKV